MGRTRVEAFSDGVLAVAITLLVLNLKIDFNPGHASVAHQLRETWPTYAAYGVSFLIIGVIWVNHHALFSLVAHVDRVLLFVNLLLLMFVTTIPFTTATLADALKLGGADARWGAVLYGISMEGMSVGYTVLLWHMMRRNLMQHPVPAEEQRKVLLRFGLGLLLYPVVTVIGLFSAPIMLAAYFVLTLYYMLEQTPLPGRQPAARG
jgi:uncharacterized membrane protein